jgi:acyl carrier protein
VAHTHNNRGWRFHLQHSCQGAGNLPRQYDPFREKPQKHMSAIEQTIIKVATIIINELKLEDVTPETFNPDLDLVDEVGIDSMDLATIALAIRDEFTIRIDEDDYPKLTTVRIIAEYIGDKQKEK